MAPDGAQMRVEASVPLILMLLQLSVRVSAIDPEKILFQAKIPPARSKSGGPTTSRSLPASSASMLRTTLYGPGVDPYSTAKAFASDLKGYPHTHLTAPVVDNILARLKQQGMASGYWVECGSFIGNSAIVAARSIKAAGLASALPLVAIDPFTGDVNMWAWHLRRARKRQFDFLKMGNDGHIRIYETFLANVAASGFARQILPVRATSTVGLKLLARLKMERRIERQPVVVYLDAAHEKGETMVELETAWSVLARPGGFLLGDDFGSPHWPGVTAAVTAFARSQNLTSLSPQELTTWDVPGAHARQVAPGLILLPGKIGGQWIIRS